MRLHASRVQLPVHDTSEPAAVATAAFTVTAAAFAVTAAAFAVTAAAGRFDQSSATAPSSSAFADTSSITNASITIVAALAVATMATPAKSCGAFPPPASHAAGPSFNICHLAR